MEASSGPTAAMMTRKTKSPTNKINRIKIRPKLLSRRRRKLSQSSINRKI